MGGIKNCGKNMTRVEKNVTRVGKMRQIVEISGKLEQN